MTLVLLYISDDNSSKGYHHIYLRRSMYNLHEQLFQYTFFISYFHWNWFHSKMHGHISYIEIYHWIKILRVLLTWCWNHQHSSDQLSEIANFYIHWFLLLVKTYLKSSKKSSLVYWINILIFRLFLNILFSTK